MSIGDIKSFLGSQAAVSPDQAIDKQLQESGLRQAREFNANIESTLSSKYTLAFTALSQSFERNVEIEGQRPQRSSVSEEQESDSVFDFEEVVDNVFGFVSRVIQNAARSGTDDEELNSLFEQASSGISRGISAARSDLSAVLDDELSTGIDSVERSLGERIDQLREAVFSPIDVVEENVSSFANADVSIRTRDGDNVTINFAQARSATSSLNNISELGAEQTGARQTISNIERLGVEILVSGSLEEDELFAINDLVGQIANVADEFFNGDIVNAFEQALELGFDQQELATFSVQLTRGQSVSSVQAYENVQNYNEDSVTDSSEQRPVRQYISDLLQSIDQSRQLLESRDDYSNIVNGIVNTLGEEVRTPDLISAINEFNQFNNRIINGLN